MPHAPGRATRLALAGIGCALLVPLASCSCDEGKITVTVSPASVSLATSATQKFDAVVTGNPNHAVSWSVQESSGGTISADGTYTAPSAPGTFHVVAASVANPKDTGVATVTVTPLMVGSYTVVVSPPQATLQAGDQLQLTAVVKDGSGATVTLLPVWSTSAGSVATVSSTGLVSAAEPGTATITATYQGASGSSAVTVNAVATGNGPRLDCLDPQYLEAGSPTQSVKLYGEGLVANATGQVNGVDRISLLSAPAFLVQLLDTDLTSAGVLSLTVTVPPPDGGVSNALSLHVRPAAVTALISTALDGDGGNSQSPELSTSSSGRFVAFSSQATDLIAGDPRTAGASTLAVYLRDTCLGADAGCVPSTLLVSGSDDGGFGTTAASQPSLSADGRFVAYRANSHHLDGGIGPYDSVFLRDTCAGVSGCTPHTTEVAASTSGALADGDSSSPALSPTGRFVAFRSSASNLGAPGTSDQIFVRDTCLGAAACTPVTLPVSLFADGGAGNGQVDVAGVTTDGRYVVFDSDAPLVDGDLNTRLDVFVRDTCLGQGPGCSPSTVRLSGAADGGDGDGDSHLASITPDGRYVAFMTAATNLVPDDTNTEDDVLVRDTCLGAPSGCVPSLERVSMSSCTGPYGEASRYPSISADGRYVAFQGYTTAQVFVLVRDRCLGAPGCIPATVHINGDQTTQPKLSGDGRWVGFSTFASDDLRLIRTLFP